MTLCLHFFVIPMRDNKVDNLSSGLCRTFLVCFRSSQAIYPSYRVATGSADCDQLHVGPTQVLSSPISHQGPLWLNDISHLWEYRHPSNAKKSVTPWCPSWWDRNWYMKQSSYFPGGWLWYALWYVSRKVLGKPVTGSPSWWPTQNTSLWEYQRIVLGLNLLLTTYNPLINVVSQKKKKIIHSFNKLT